MMGASSKRRGAGILRRFSRNSEGLTLVALALACGATGCQVARNVQRDFGDFAQKSFDIVTNRTAGTAARKMEDPYFPDERRDGINRLAARTYGRGEPYTARYAQIAQTDTDYLVRATAIRALNRSRDASATPLFLKALDDENSRVRLEAAKALANVPDEAAQAKLLKMAGDDQEERDVRIAATDALRNFKRLEVARGLIGLLNQRDFGVSWQALQSLRSITGRDYRYDESAWLGLLASPENPFS